MYTKKIFAAVFYKISSLKTVIDKYAVQQVIIFNPLAPELFFFKFRHILYIKCEKHRNQRS